MTSQDRFRIELEKIGGLRVKREFNRGAEIELEDTSPEKAAAVRAFIDNFDWSDEAHKTWQTAYDREKAIAALFADPGYVQVGVRANFRVLWTALNDVREQLGLPRLLEPAIAQLLVAAIQAGEGDPIS